MNWKERYAELLRDFKMTVDDESLAKITSRLEKIETSHSITKRWEKTDRKYRKGIRSATKKRRHVLIGNIREKQCQYLHATWERKKLKGNVK